MTGADDESSPEVVLTLPEEERAAFKDPMGPVEKDPERLLEAVDGFLVAVGDAVTYHLVQAGRRPDVAVVDGLTEREAVDDAVSEATAAEDAIQVRNPAATLTESLLSELCRAIHRGEPRTILVDGEEDLATLPAVVAAPSGASVVYGQPGEGMVHVKVDNGVRDHVRDLLTRLDGDHDRLWALCDRD